MRPIKGNKTTARKARSGISAARLAEMIEEATVDAYDESEQATGWFTMLEYHLELPFETDLLGVRVTIEAIEQHDGNRIVAVCRRGKEKLAVGIADQLARTPALPGSRATSPM